MPITDAQREQRSRHIGSSDAAAIVGLDPYKSAYDIWLEKKGKVEPDESQNEAAEIGNMIENSLLDWAAAETGHLITKNQRRVHKTDPIAANHDALGRDHQGDWIPIGFEAKTSGILNPFNKNEEWGDAGTDQVPDRVTIQCHHQMMVSDLNVVYVPALIGGRGRMLYVVEKDPRLCEALEMSFHRFWYDFLQADVPPSDFKPSMDYLKRIKREPGTIVDIDDEIVSNWLVAKEELKRVEAVEKDAKKALIMALGEAEAGNSSLGMVTFLQQSRTAIDSNAFKKAHPELANEFLKKTTFRVLRTKKAKKGKVA